MLQCGRSLQDVRSLPMHVLLQQGMPKTPLEAAAQVSLSEHVGSRLMAGIAGDERICSICVYSDAEIYPRVPQVTLQTRLRRPVWPNTAAFRAFVNAHKEHVEISACRSCRMRCGMPVWGRDVWGNPARPS